MLSYKGLVLNFDFRFASFRRPYTTTSQLSFILPPLSTFKGMLASILGIKRDQYYEMFENSKFGFKLNKEPKQAIISQNLINTKYDLNEYLSSGKIKKRSPTKIEVWYNLNFDAYVLLDESAQKAIGEKMEIIRKSELYFNISAGGANMLGRYKLLAEEDFEVIDAKGAQVVDTAVNPEINRAIPKHGTTFYHETDVPTSFKLTEKSRALLANRIYAIIIPLGQIEILSGPLYKSNSYLITCLN